MKNIEKMTEKKLKALLATASDDEKTHIENELAKRAKTENDKIAERLKDDAEPQQESAEPQQESAESQQEKPIKRKLTNDELATLSASLKENIGRRCSVVPFNDYRWFDGTIVGLLTDKRAARILYAIKVDDGRKIVKVHDSMMLKLSDERVELKRQKKAKECSEWAQDAINEQIATLIPNIGAPCTIDKEDGTQYNGRIISIVPDKRVQRFLYTIEIPTPVEGNPNATRKIHKVASSTTNGLTICDIDEKGLEIQEKYKARREKRLAGPQDMVILLEERLSKALEKLEKAQKDVEEKKAALKKAKETLTADLNAQAAEVEESTNSETETDLL